MGISILELVLQKLREAKFPADTAFPGKPFPNITGTVASVHIKKVDRAERTVTLGVSVVSPAAIGGTACELEALRATEVLQSEGAACIQQGCRYDGIARVYVVEILATFTGITEADSCRLGPGFQVRIGQTTLGFVQSFSAQKKEAYQAEYAMGEEAPVGYSQKQAFWEITLRELLPAGSPEETEPEVPFSIWVVKDTAMDVYSGCRWLSEKREQTREGLLKIRTGIAEKRKEAKR